MRKQIHPLRILIADDHGLVRRSICQLLRYQIGWRVIGEAADGLEAVKKAKELKPDIAIVDIRMPGLDGVEATRQIRQLVPQTKVVVVTTHEEKQMIRRVIGAGALGYVSKSDLTEFLVKAVKSVSRGKLLLAPKTSEVFKLTDLERPPYGTR